MSHSSGYGPRNRLLFDGNPANYSTWETRFTSSLFTNDKDVHTAILPLRTKTNPANHADKNHLAYAELVQVIDEKSLQLIMHDAANDGRKALQILRQHYASTEKPRVLCLYEQLTTLRMQEQEDTADYLIRAERAATGLRAAGETISDNLVIAMLLKGLPDSFKSFVVVHTQLGKTKSLTEFKSALVNYAASEALRTEHQGSTALVSRVQPQAASYHGKKGTKTRCNACGALGHTYKQCTRKDTLTCTHCKRNGHVEAVCFTKKKDSRQHSHPNKTETAHAHSATFAFSTTTDTSLMPTELMVDCGATSHIVNDRSRFITLDQNYKPRQHFIQLADGRRTNELVMAKGVALYEVLNCTGQVQEITLKNALYAPDFPVSLFYVR